MIAPWLCVVSACMREPVGDHRAGVPHDTNLSRVRGRRILVTGIFRLVGH